eukprot:scaffold70481_cov59-Phaeocystis_antarctica.AAC.1
MSSAIQLIHDTEMISDRTFIYVLVSAVQVKVRHTHARRRLITFSLLSRMPATSPAAVRHQVELIMHARRSVQRVARATS